ncbi:Uncharacterised nucleotidyltransferase [Chitinophaga sp. CF118]|uniref:nucleotidyltransferase family protein n=1 Tax=Chitinophaga sp. CF118 TaxID=1884367 RepID=UPI0008F1842C|nr:nucleotidyltransferase family protein [Chitinophaga sp. CF118]SFD79786.1 Uncharacterised nucleotidyltransferase [Chitinophaga sp. CF118]
MEIGAIKEKYNPEIALLVLCCRVFLRTADKEMLRTFITDSSINWNKVYNLSALHRIRPVVFNILFHVKELVEQNTYQLFRSFCMNFSSRVFSRKAECDRIIDLLQQRGVSACPYKGLDFSVLLYKDMSLRESSDIDVIIAEKDVSSVVDTLKKEGYTMGTHKFYDRFPEQFHQLHKDVCFNKEGAFGGSFDFEFHFRPVKYRMNTTTSFSQLLGNDYLSPHRIYDHKDYYKLMIYNNGVSDYYPTLRSLLDLASFKADELDEEAIELKRFDLLRRVLSSHLFNMPVVETYKKDDSNLNYAVNFLLNELLKKQVIKNSDLLRNVYLGIRFSKGLKQKWNILLKAIVFFITPNGNDIESIQLPFYSYYYVTKFFRITTRRLRGLS